MVNNSTSRLPPGLRRFSALANLALASLLLAGCGLLAGEPLPTLVPTIEPIIPATGDTPTPGVFLPVPQLPTSATLAIATPAATATPPATPTTLPTPTSFPTLEPTQAPALIPTGRTSGWMPWGLIPSKEGLWAVRSDGGAVELLTNDPIFDLAIAPSGRYAAYLTHPDPYNLPENNPFGYVLKIIYPATGEIRVVAALDRQEQGADPNAALRVISAYDHGGLEWSPGGSYLAFISGHESSAGEAYFYDVRNGQVYRFPSPPPGESPTYAFDLRFSPSGTKIYYNRAYDFGSSAYALAGSWVAGTDGSLVQLAGDETAGEQLIAWLNESQVLLSSSQPDCGEQNLRLVNLRTQQAQSIWPGCFSDRIFERGLGAFIISVTPEVTAFQPDTPPGLYRVRIWDGSVQQITGRVFDKLYSGPQNYTWYGFRPAEGLSLITLGGQVTPAFLGPPYDGSDPEINRPLRPVTGQPAWLWDGNGLFLADPTTQGSTQPRAVFPFPVENLTQSPTDRTLYFFLAYDGVLGRLYAIRSNEWQPYLVDERIQTPAGISWTR